MNKILFVFLIFSSSLFYSQDSLIFSFIKSYNLDKYSTWDVDSYSNIYIYSNKSLNKIDFNGITLFRQSVKSIGNVKEIDVKNPLKILLFSEEQQNICILDNTLSIQNQINLNDFDVNYITHISSSNQVDKIWIFDQQNSQLKQLNNSTLSEIKINNLSSLLSIKNVYKILEKNNHIFIADSLNGIFEFDIFGSLIQHYKINKSDCFDIQNQYIITHYDNKIYLYSILNLSEKNFKEIKLPIKNCVKFKIQNENIYIESENKLNIYKLLW